MYKVRNDITDIIISVSDKNSAINVLELIENGTVFDRSGKLLDTKKTAFRLLELPETTQREIYDNWEFETDLFTDSYTDYLTMLGFNNPVLAYSVSFSQSDYACFSSDCFDYQKGFVAQVRRIYGDGDMLDFAKRLQDIYKKTAYKMFGSVVAGRCRSFEKVECDFNSWLDDYSSNLLLELQDALSYQSSFEMFVDTCDVNDYLFSENGGDLL